jgi:uncharacterized protein (DUF736 family)
MNIGTVTPTTGGELSGHMAIMSFDARIGFRPVASANERAPKFEVVALNVARRWVRIGALWEKEARESGEIYLTGYLDDPALPDKLYVAAFRQEGGGYAVAWTRTGLTAARSDGSEPASDGEPIETVVVDKAPPRGRRRSALPEPAADDPFA